MHKFILLFIMPIFLNITVYNSSKPTKTNNISYKTYCNNRYGFCIDYPENILYPQPESTNGDGLVFKNKKAEEILKVFGRSNAKPGHGFTTIEQQYSEDLQDISISNSSVITYKKLGAGFFVISGYRDKQIFYQKTILKGNAFCYVVMQYKESDKKVFDEISQRVFKSFN